MKLSKCIIDLLYKNDNIDDLILKYFEFVGVMRIDGACIFYDFKDGSRIKTWDCGKKFEEII